jgi:hypothetical protein
MLEKSQLQMKEMESKFDQRMTKLESKNMQLVDKVMQQDHTIIKVSLSKLSDTSCSIKARLSS